MTGKHLAALAAVALVFAACSSSETDADDSDPPTASPASGSTVPSATDPSSDAGSSLSVTPALGITGSASDSFDAAGLSDRGGSRFVPMDNPIMVPASEVSWLNDDSIVMGVTHSSGVSHAYPVGQMAYHHIANTTIAGEPFLVTY